MLSHVREAKRLGAPDHLPEDAAAARELADSRVRPLVDPEREEALELAPALIEDSQGGVAGLSQLARRVEHRLEHALQIETCDEGTANLDQPAQPRLIESPRIHAGNGIAADRCATG